MLTPTSDFDVYKYYLFICKKVADSTYIPPREVNIPSDVPKS